MNFSLLGLVLFARSKPKQGVVLLVFSILNIWVLSSWDCWWYADSFSQRSIVQSYPVFFLALGFLIQKTQTRSFKLTIGLSAIMLVLIAFNLFQVFQFNNWILHSQRMTKEYYWNIFGITEGNKADRSLLDIDRNLNYLPEKPIIKQSIIYKDNFESEGTFAYKQLTFKREGSITIDNGENTLQPIKFAVRDLFDTSFAYIVCKVRLRSNFEASENNFGIEFTTTDLYNGKRYGYKYKNLTNLESYQKGKWNTLELIVIPPILRGEGDSIQFDFRHFGTHPIEVDQITAELFDPSSVSKNEKLEFLLAFGR